MFEIVKAGGIVMVPIILCSILAVAIILERFWTLREQRVVPIELTDKVWQWVENRSLSDQQINIIPGGQQAYPEIIRMLIDHFQGLCPYGTGRSENAHAFDHTNNLSGLKGNIIFGIKRYPVEP